MAEHIAIVGAGLMGTGIAQAFAVAGYEVSLFDPQADALHRAPELIAQSLRELGDARVPVQLRLSTSIADAVANASIVFECGPERLDIKRQIFR